MMRRSARELLDWLCTGAGSAPHFAVVAAHPDDETIGAGARLRRLRDAFFICVTDGAPADPADALAAGCHTRAEYAAARRKELEEVFALAGVRAERWRSLDIADQAASLDMAELARALTALLRAEGPEAVLTQPYEGGHPDHDATALATRAACRMLGGLVDAPPVILEMTSYHAKEDTMASGGLFAGGRL